MNGQTKKSSEPGLLERVKNWFRRPLKKAPPVGAERYHPEKHYMRGPGPKTRAKERLEMRIEPLA